MVEAHEAKRLVSAGRDSPHPTISKLVDYSYPAMLGPTCAPLGPIFPTRTNLLASGALLIGMMI